MSVRGTRSVNIGLRNVVLTILIGLGFIFVWQIRGTLMADIRCGDSGGAMFTMPVRLLVDRLRINRLVAILVSVIGFFVILVLIGIPILRAIGDQYEPLKTRVESGFEQVRESLTREALLEQNSILKDVVPIIEGLLSGGGECPDV